MKSLAVRLQGALVYDEFSDLNIDSSQPEIKLIRGILERALLDLMAEIKDGIDLKVPYRTHQYGSGKPYIPKIKTSGKGRKPFHFHLSPYAFFFSDDVEHWSFLWCCQQIASDWKGYAESFRRKIIKKILFINMDCQNAR